MTSVNGNNKQITPTQAKANFEKFLKDHKVTSQPISHTAFGPPFGSYLIPDDKMDDFFKVYCTALENGIELHMVERPTPVGPLLIDIDFHLDEQDSKRQYKLENIKYIIKCATEIIQEIFVCNSNTTLAYVFEKKEPSKVENKQNETIEWKDGFHIVYPNVAMNIGMRYYIIDRIKKMTVEENAFNNINFINSVDDVFDTSVIKANGWMMYGSRKHNGQLYTLRYIFTAALKVLPITRHTSSDLVRLLSNRKFSAEDETATIEDINMEEFQEIIDDVLREYNVLKDQKPVLKQQVQKKPTIKQKQNEEDPELENEEDIKDELLKNRRERNALKTQRSKKKEIELARSLVAILDKKRASSYDPWVKVGWALHNISPTLLGTFKEFSKKAGPKIYNEQSCVKIWESARSDGLSIASLRHWAKIDDIDAYEEIMTESINELLLEAESRTEYDMSKVILELYKDEYRCTDIERNVWYEYQGHRWVLVPSGYTLSARISEEVVREFARLNMMYLKKASDRGGEGGNKDDLFTKANNAMKIISDLKKIGFKKRVIEECRHRFFDPEFEEKLDSKRNLIGFNNGVYDLEADIFRAGTPDDYVHMTVGYDYEEYSYTHPYVLGIIDFFAKTHRDPEMREYILTLMASYLDGNTNTEQFILWTGTGANGKSKSVELFQLGFGDYCGVMPITVLTRKRTGTGQATPELAEMKGKRFVVFQEPDNDDEIQVGLMKELTGGDWIYARKLYGSPFRYKPQFKLLLTCNVLPAIPSNDGGTWRRIRVAQWETEFVDHPKLPHQFEKDPDLIKKLEMWKKAFIWYLIKKYYKIYRENNYKIKEPEKVTQFTNNYKKSSDIYLEFLDANMKITNNNEHCESFDSLFAAFKCWYGESYSGKPTGYNKKNIVEYLSNNKYKIDKRYVYGMRFRDDNDK